MLVSLPTPVAVLLRQVRDSLLAFPWVERVVLYGSYARGDWSVESDVDLAAFLQQGTPCDLERYMTLSRLCRSCDYDVQLQLFSVEELLDPCGIVEEVAAYGVDLTTLNL